MYDVRLSDSERLWHPRPPLADALSTLTHLHIYISLASLLHAQPLPSFLPPSSVRYIMLDVLGRRANVVRGGASTVLRWLQIFVKRPDLQRILIRLCMDGRAQRELMVQEIFQWTLGRSESRVWVENPPHDLGDGTGFRLSGDMSLSDTGMVRRRNLQSLQSNFIAGAVPECNSHDL